VTDPKKKKAAPRRDPWDIRFINRLITQKTDAQIGGSRPTAGQQIKGIAKAAGRQAIEALPGMGALASGKEVRKGHLGAGAFLLATEFPLLKGLKRLRSAMKGAGSTERFAILTAENAGGRSMSAAENAVRNRALVAELKKRGYEPTPAAGRYKDTQTGEILQENSFIVPGLGEREAKLLGKRYGQNSIITHRGFHDLTTGDLFPSKGTVGAREVPYTEVDGKRFALDIDWDNPVKSRVNALPVPKNAQPEAMRLIDELRGSMPNAPKPLPRVKAIPPEKGKLMASVFRELPRHDPNAAEAYKALNSEVAQQFKAIQDAGYKIEFVDKDPYKNSAELFEDISKNRTLKVLKTNEGTKHPFLSNEQNDAFRAVHDFIAHAGGGNQFGPVGEEGAYRIHASTLSPLAQRALATETRGQNSFVNFGPNAHLPPAERPFAEQKAALWPEQLLGDYGEMPNVVRMDVRERASMPGVKSVQYASPAGSVNVIASGGGKNKLLTENIEIDPLDPNATDPRGLLGPGGVRAVYRDLQQLMGGESVEGLRVSGANPDRVANRPLPSNKPSGGFAADSLVARAAARARVSLVDTRPAIGATQYRFKTDGGDVVVMGRREGDDFYVKWMGMHGDPTARPGAGAVRQIGRLLRQETGARTISGERISGARAVGEGEEGGRMAKRMLDSLPNVSQRALNRRATIARKAQEAAAIRTGDPRASWGTLFDYNSLGRDVLPELQENIPREGPVSAVGYEGYLNALDRTAEGLKTPQARRLLDEGIKEGGHLWYYLDPLARVFIDELGEKEGIRRFKLYTSTVAATSPNSEVTKNLERAAAVFPMVVRGENFSALDMHKILRPNKLSNTAANTAYRPMLSRVTAGQKPIAAVPLKADAFDANLGGNFEPLTADRHYFRQVGFRTPKVPPAQYLGVEDATQEHARQLAREGALPVAEGRSPTAPLQAAMWIGDARTSGRVRSPIEPALSTIERQIRATAQRMGIDPTEALRRFVRGELWQYGGRKP
jgi:hypothetical protein